MKIASERSINRILIPFKKDVEFPYTIVTKPTLRKNVSLENNIEKNITISNKWTAKNFMMLDIVTDIALKTFYSQRNVSIPLSPYKTEESNFILYQNFDKFTLENHDNFMILGETELRCTYKFLNKYSSSQLCDIIKSTCECSFDLPYYETRVMMKTKNSKNFPYIKYKFEQPQRIFSIVKLYEEKAVKRVTHRAYKISFFETFSNLFLSNVRSINIDWIDEKLYDLPDISQNMYRTIILSNCNTFIESADRIAEKSGITINNGSTHLVTIRKHLAILKDKGFIFDFKETKIRDTFFEIIKSQDKNEN